MRDIRFRAWEKKLKEMIPVHDINFDTRIINTHSAWRLFDEIELMQYTGVDDANSTPIYEGDVCRVVNPNGDEDKLCFVDFDPVSSCYTYEPDDGYGDYDISSIGWAMQLGFRFEIIGNVYEHSHLLEVDDQC